MKKIVFILTIFLSAAIADDCAYYLKMGKMQENAAAKAYNSGNIAKTQTHLRHALSNYMNGFKPCLNTSKEDELINSSARVNGILTNNKFRNAAAMQKFIKAATEK